MDDYANFLFLGWLREAEVTVRGALDKLDHRTMRLRHCFYDFLMMLDTRWAMGVGVACSVSSIAVLSPSILFSSRMNRTPTGWAWGSSGYRCSLNRKDNPLFL